MMSWTLILTFPSRILNLNSPNAHHYGSPVSAYTDHVAVGVAAVDENTTAVLASVAAAHASSPGDPTPDAAVAGIALVIELAVGVAAAAVGATFASSDPSTDLFGRQVLILWHTVCWSDVYRDVHQCTLPQALELGNVPVCWELLNEPADYLRGVVLYFGFPIELYC